MSDPHLVAIFTLEWQKGFISVQIIQTIINESGLPETNRIDRLIHVMMWCKTFFHFCLQQTLLEEVGEDWKYCVTHTALKTDHRPHAGKNHFNLKQTPVGKPSQLGHMQIFRAILN